MDDTKKSVIAILAYLEDKKKAGGLNEVQLESLGVAILSLEDTYEVSGRDVHLLTPHGADGKVSFSSVAQSSQGAGSDPGSSPAQEASPEDQQEAERLKNEGNDFMKAEKFPEALESYTQAIKKHRKNAVYYCNRAAAYGRMREHLKAIEDCKAALSVDPVYSKAYGRMGIAFTALDKHESAVACHRRALELEPDSENYRTNLEIAEQKIRLSNSKNTGPTASEGSEDGWWDTVTKFGDQFNDPFFLSKLTDLMRDPRSQKIVLGFMSNQRKTVLTSILDIGHVLLDHFSDIDTELPPAPPQLQRIPDLVQRLMSEVNRPTTSDSDDQDDPPSEKE